MHLATFAFQLSVRVMEMFVEQENTVQMVESGVHVLVPKNYKTS